MPLSLALPTRLSIAAARSPPESGPASRLRRATAAPRCALDWPVVEFELAVIAIAGERFAPVQRIEDRLTGIRFARERFERRCERRCEPRMESVE